MMRQSNPKDYDLVLPDAEKRKFNIKRRLASHKYASRSTDASSNAFYICGPCDNMQLWDHNLSKPSDLGVVEFLDKIKQHSGFRTRFATLLREKKSKSSSSESSSSQPIKPCDVLFSSQQSAASQYEAVLSPALSPYNMNIISPGLLLNGYSFLDHYPSPSSWPFTTTPK